MEVKEAIEWFEWANDVYYCSIPNEKPNNEFYRQGKKVIDLLKSLASENKKLKQENEAYKGMWEELENRYIDKPMFNGDAPIILNQQLRWLEQKYLGGEE
jgi:hypothetical protein